jgi:Flp pilus assembly protein TadG
MLRKMRTCRTSQAQPKPAAPTRLRRFARDRKGATAVEFAIVALPFFMMIFATFELALVFLISLTLDNATTNSARQIRTGTVQATGGGASSTGGAAFKTAICNSMGWLQTQCQSNLSIDVRTLPQFKNPTAPDPLVTSGGTTTFNSSSLCFYSGNAGDIVLIRAFFQWPLLTPFLNRGLQRLSNGSAVITSTATFRNEPFGGTAQSGGTTC